MGEGYPNISLAIMMFTGNILLSGNNRIRLNNLYEMFNLNNEPTGAYLERSTVSRDLHGKLDMGIPSRDGLKLSWV